jgi:hypothetical protein
MNPLTNRWAALLVAAGVLLIVAELADQGGVLSQYAADAPEVAAPAKETTAVEAAATNVEDQPQEAFAEEAEDEDGLQLDEDPFAFEDGAEGEGDSEREDSAPSEPGTSIVSAAPPGPPGIFNGE